MLDQLKKKSQKIDIIKGFGKDRDLKLFKYKILLNIGYDNDCKIYESIRCDRCIYNKMIVISDKKFNFENYHLSKYIIFEDFNKIPDTIEYVLNNYDTIYNNMFNDFNIEDIDLNLKQISKKIIDELT